MSVLLALTTVLKTVTTLETVEGSHAPVTLDTPWTLMDTPALVGVFNCNYFNCNTVIFIIIIDINECSTNDGGCSGTCVNTAGSYYCTCPSGYSLGSNSHSCIGEPLIVVRIRL